jgi:hypothetical protein
LISSERCNTLAQMDISKKARELSPAALRTLASIADDPIAAESARVAAANSILDRAYGKPTQATISLSLDKGASAKLVAMDDSALLALIGAARVAQGSDLVAISDSRDGVTPALPSPTRQVEMGRRTYDSVATPVQQKASSKPPREKRGGGSNTEPPPVGESEFERMLRDPLLA